MLNLRVDIPLKEDVIDRLQLIMSQIRDLTLEAEQIVKMCLDEDILMTKEDVQRKLQMDSIPSGIPKMRIGNKTRYNRKDVLAFLESKKR